MSKQIPNINNLHNEKDIKEKELNNLYSIVLNKCIDEISFTNKSTDKTYIIFEVPNIIITQFSVKYDQILCINYLISQFNKKGYFTKFYQPNYLYIDWGVNESKLNNKYINEFISMSRLEKQKNELLKKYPNASKIQFVYEK
jgi:hypothetical protein